MKPTIQPDKWYVYRHNHSRHVLRSSVTELQTWEGKHGELMASFDMSGWDDPLAAEMLLDPAIGAWYGESGCYDFRWAPLKEGKTDMLIGYASDRQHADYCDSFFALKDKRTVELPVKDGKEKVYSFASSLLTPFQRGKGSDEWGLVSVDLDLRKIELKGGEITFSDVVSWEHDGGVKVIGELNPRTENELRIELWILPLDQTGQLLATGYFSEAMSLFDTSPGPNCTFTFHARGG